MYLDLYTPSVTDCAAITASHLGTVTRLQLGSRAISALQVSDFIGLTALEILDLGGNQLGVLPAGVFTGLTALTELRLSFNRLSKLPARLFTGLTALEELYLHDNQLGALPPGLFTGLVALEELWLHNNQIEALPTGIFTGLTDLEDLLLGSNRLSGLKIGDFTGLTALQYLYLSGNRIEVLPNSVFAGLTSLGRLELSSNRLSALPAGVFTNLTALTEIDLSNNQLSTLPAGVFTGLTALAALRLDGNTAGDLPLPVSLMPIGGGRVKATIATGAPFALTLPINSTNGSLSNAGGSVISNVTIATGGSESAVFTVTRTPGATSATSVDLGTLPVLPTDRNSATMQLKHQGYRLARSGNLPLQLEPGVALDSTRLEVTEGSSSGYPVVLNTQPTGEVTVSIAGNNDDVTTTPALTFATGNWNLAQTVTVSAMQDDDTTADMATLVHTVSGYGAVNAAADVAVTVPDNDVIVVEGLIAPTINGHRVIIEGKTGIPPNIRLGLPPTLAQPLDITFLPPADDLRLQSGQFGFGSVNTAIAITVSFGPVDGLELCLPVPASLRTEARGRALVLLRYDNGIWRAVENAELVGLRVCAAGVMVFSPFSVGYAYRVTANVNGDSIVNAEDALLLFYAYSFADMPVVRDNLLRQQVGNAINQVVNKARAWELGLKGDVNGDRLVNEQDALVMYYTYQFRDILRNSPALQAVLLGTLAGPGMSLNDLLRNAERLR